MYEGCMNRLRFCVMSAQDCVVCPIEGDCDGLDAVMSQAADAIEAMNMKLLGDDAAIAGMKREIERMVTESSDLNKRLMAVTLELNRATKRLCEWCGVCPEGSGPSAPPTTGGGGNAL